MECPYCAVTIAPNWQRGTIAEYHESETGFEWRLAYCPSCNEAIIMVGLFYYAFDYEGGRLREWSDGSPYLAYPRFAAAKSVHEAVPEWLQSDYQEACAVLPVSAKASATLSRRVLQGILKAQGYNSDNLSEQIKNVLAEQDLSKVLPTTLQKTVDAIRRFGNFSAHPTADVTVAGGSSHDIIPVEPEEAEWCIEIVESLFKHYYIQPAEDGKRLTALDQKLKQAGK